MAHTSQENSKIIKHTAPWGNSSAQLLGTVVRSAIMALTEGGRRKERHTSSKESSLRAEGTMGS